MHSHPQGRHDEATRGALLLPGREGGGSAVRLIVREGGGGGGGGGREVGASKGLSSERGRVTGS